MPHTTFGGAGGSEYEDQQTVDPYGGAFSQPDTWGSVIEGVGVATSAIGQYLTNKAQSKEAKKARAFQQTVGQNSVQWRVADMKAAGINPILAVNPGGGSSMPGGVQAQFQNPLKDTATTGLATKRLSQEMRNLKATEKTTGNQGLKFRAETLAAMQNTRTSAETQRKISADARISEAGATLAELDSKIYKHEMGPWLRALQLGAGSAKALRDMFRMGPKRPSSGRGNDRNSVMPSRTNLYDGVNR